MIINEREWVNRVCDAGEELDSFIRAKWPDGAPITYAAAALVAAHGFTAVEGMTKAKFLVFVGDLWDEVQKHRRAAGEPSIPGMRIAPDMSRPR